MPKSPNLQPQVDRLISESFPELRSQDIRVTWADLDDALLTVAELDPEGWFIECDRTLRSAPAAVLIGVLAHELAHVLADLMLDRLSRKKDRAAYKLSKRYRVLSERNADLDTILRGFGPQLLAFLEHAERKGFEHYEEDGLSLRELRLLV